MALPAFHRWEDGTWGLHHTFRILEIHGAEVAITLGLSHQGFPVSADALQQVPGALVSGCSGGEWGHPWEGLWQESPEQLTKSF